MSKVWKNTKAFLAGLLAVSIVMIAWTAAEAGEKRKPPATTATATAKQQQGQEQQQSQKQVQKQSVDATTISDSSADASNGDQISMNTSQFYALSLMFPQASGCFVGAQGGAQDSDIDGGTSGFLGFHWLNKSCWLQQQASVEQDIEINARLKCGDKKYRNAVAYDVPRNERQETCIAMKVASAKQQMDNLNAELSRIEDSSKKRLEELQACHARVDTANERTERCFETLVQGK